MQYGVEYAYGPYVINRGNQPNVLVRFRWAKDLNQWIVRGAYQPAGPGCREAVTSRHPYVRLSQRKPEGWERDDEGVDVYRVTD